MATTLVTGKRKRNQVSYNADKYFDELDIEVDAIDDAEDISDNDESFDSRKTFGKTPAKKKVKASKTTKNTKTEKPFRFLDLPAELRDEIYELCLTDPNGIVLASRVKSHRRIVSRGSVDVETGNASYYGKKRRQGRYSWWGYGSRDSQTTTISDRVRSLVPNLLAVSKQVRDEGSGYLYKQELVVEDTTALQTFVAQIGQYNRDRLSDITIKGWGTGRGVHKGNNYSAFCLLASCTNLENVFLDCSIGYYHAPRKVAGQIFRDGFVFLEAYASANGINAAVDVIELPDWHLSKSRKGRYDDQYNMEKEDNNEVDPKKEQEFRDELRSLLSRRR